MHPDNKHTDKKLQELENQSLPDLSKIDEHWQQMQSLLQPGTVSVKPKNGSVRKYFSWIVAAIFIGGLSFLTMRWLLPSSPEKKTVTKTVEPPVKSLPTDTVPAIKIIGGKDTITIKKQKPAIIPIKTLKVRTTDGHDTSLQVMPVNEISQPAIAEPHASLAAFFKQLEEPVQEFVINSKRDTLITGSDGTVLLVPANSFNSNGPVKIIMKEYYSYTDIITNRLTTCSDGRQLITGGMIHLKAVADGKEINIEPGKSIRWFVPDTSSSLSQMQLFTGSTGRRNSLSSLQEEGDGMTDLMTPVDTMRADGSLEIVNWIPGDQSFTSSYLVTIVKVLDLSNEPFRTKNTKKGEIGLFHISQSPKISQQKLKTELKERYGYYKVKIKNYEKRGGFFFGLLKQRNTTSYNNPVGDSAWIGSDVAKKYKLKATDSITYQRNRITYTNGNYVKRAFTNINLNDLANRFSVDIRTLCWINCDRFYNDNRPKLNYYVDLKDTASNYYTVLVFDKLRSMVRGTTSGNRVLFYGVPKGESAKIICVGIQNGKTVAAMENLPASGTLISNLKFEETNPTAFKENVSVMDE